MSETALLPEPPIKDMEGLKSWLETRYEDLCLTYDRYFLNNNPQMHNIHARRLEIIEVGKAIGLNLGKSSLEEE